MEKVDVDLEQEGGGSIVERDEKRKMWSKIIRTFNFLEQLRLGGFVSAGLRWKRGCNISSGQHDFQCRQRSLNSSTRLPFLPASPLGFQPSRRCISHSGWSFFEQRVYLKTGFFGSAKDTPEELVDEGCAYRLSQDRKGITMTQDASIDQQPEHPAKATNERNNEIPDRRFK